MSRGQAKPKPPVPTWEEQRLELGRRLADVPRIPREVLALYYTRWVDRLSTPESRQELARFFRKGFSSSQEQGAETMLYLNAADAIERQDWPLLGLVLRETERMDFDEKLQEHRRIVRLGRWLEKLAPGTDL